MNWTVLVMASVDAVFEAFFFGSGSWLGLMLMSILIIGVTFKWREAGLLMIPVSVILALNYLDQNCGWESLIMFLLTIFMLVRLTYRR